MTMADTRPSARDRSELELLLRGFMVSRMLRLVADLGLADRIALESQVAVRDLAAACGVQHGPLMRVLRTLASVGVFRLAPEGTVAHSAKSALLRTDAPDSAHYAARFWAGPGSWGAWGRLDVALAGAVPHEAAWGQGRFAYLREHPEEARAFDEMMAHFPDDRHAAVAAAYDFSAAHVVADVGGGNGAMLRHVLARKESARGLLFDRPDVIAGLGPEALMHGRIDAVGGNFLDAVPAGADHVILSRVLHDWPDEECLRILANCRASMAPGAVLLVVESLLEPDPARGQPTDYLIDVQMMAMFGTGRQRSESEFRELLAAAGFAWRRRVPTASSVSVLEAVAT
jgi:hypothetical protein